MGGEGRRVLICRDLAYDGSYGSSMFNLEEFSQRLYYFTFPLGKPQIPPGKSTDSNAPHHCQHLFTYLLAVLTCVG